MQRKRIAAGTLALALMATALVFATAGAGAQSATFEAAWIYVGPHNDGGWSQSHDDGRLYAQKRLGAKVKTTYKETRAGGPAGHAGDRRAHPRRQQDHLRDLVRLSGRPWWPQRRSTRM